MTRSSLFALVVLLAAAAPGAGASSSFCLKGGLSHATILIDPDPPIEFDNTTRFGGGLGFSFGLSPQLTLDLDLLYMMKGAETEVSYVYGDYEIDAEVKTRLDYATVSPTLRITPMGERGIYFLGGVEIGYILRARARVEGSALGISVEQEEDIKEGLKDVDTSLRVGAGFQFPLGDEGRAFLIEGHYVHSLQDIAEDADAFTVSDDVPTEEYTAKNRALYIFAGIRL